MYENAFFYAVFKKFKHPAFFFLDRKIRWRDKRKKKNKIENKRKIGQRVTRWKDRIASKSYDWIRSSSRIEFVLDLAPKLVRGATLYIAINITRKLERFKEKKGKKEKNLKDCLSLFLSLYASTCSRFVSLERLDNFVLRHGIYCAILASFLFYCGISSFLETTTDSNSFYRAEYRVTFEIRIYHWKASFPSRPSDPNVSALYLVNQS